MIQVFAPSITQASPSRRAVVRIAATSEPVSGSEMAIAPTFVPAIEGASQRRFCSGVPWRWIAPVAMNCCTETAATKPPMSERGSSSRKASAWKIEAPVPPSSSGKRIPRKPRSPIRRKTSRGIRRASSHSRA